ncbi:MAG: hypothetical protein A2W99_12175 [Bacteroidetes bacterium GWF2_33_16]|nr:MAG: hypothetical protein A2X00_02100 [Bacteroidetes bacterium GWE2_32_14]OFY06454.1 MAG: hypothetical protein A2W99_12175 [Bacteroidetes bacterium GWF2_33_16]
MRKRIGKDRVYIYFIDNDDGFIREIISKTDQLNSYNIQIYLRSRDFINDFARFKPSRKNVNIVFISNHLEIDENGNSVDMIDVLKKIKAINSGAEVILYSDSDNIDTVSLAFHHGVYTAIKKNENFALRLENNIKGILSQKNFILRKQSGILITEIFIIFVILTAVLLIILYFLFPQWFII